MGKKQKKPKQGNAADQKGLSRKAQWETSKVKQQHRDSYHRYQVAMSYATTVLCRCTQCQSEVQLTIEKTVLPIIGNQLLNSCTTCEHIVAFDVIAKNNEESIVSNRRAQTVSERAITACKRNGLKARFWNQYLLITGQKMRWYLEYASWHKSLYFCSKWHRLNGSKLGFTLFFSKRVCSIDEAVADIAMCEELSTSKLKLVPGANMSPEIKAMFRQQRIIKVCHQYGLTPNFNKDIVTIQTSIGEWKFNYTRDKITLLHRNSNGPVLEPLSGAVMDYHVQYANADKTVEDVVEGIVSHDEWRVSIMEAKSRPEGHGDEL